MAVLSGCSRPAAGESPYGTVFPVEVGGSVFQVEVVFRDRERARGLQGREHLPEGHGMLFLFERPRQQFFWMRNTSIPLDIGFFDESGLLREILPLIPHSEDRVASRHDHIQFALEVNRGGFSRAGVQPGDRLNLSQVGQALRARGGDPTRFSIR